MRCTIVVTARVEQVGDQPSVATSRERLGAEERRRRAGERISERYLPGVAPHAGCVRAKCRLAQAREPLLARLVGEASAELDLVDVVDPDRAQRLRKRAAVELRI